MPDSKRTPISDETTNLGLDELRRRIEAGTRKSENHHVEVMVSLDDIRVQVAAGVVDGFALIMSDDKMVSKFWKTGYTNLAYHGGNDASQWIGKRLLTAAVIALATACLAWLLRNGAFK